MESKSLKGENYTTEKMVIMLKEPYVYEQQAIKWWKFWKIRRYVVAVLVFFGFFNAYCLRSNLSVAIVAMTDKPGLNENNTKSSDHTFNWSSNYRGMVLGSFFYGYVLTQLPGGWLADKCGGKILFGWGVACTAFLTLLTPVMAQLDVHALIALRVLEGFLEGAAHPAAIYLWSKWAPPLERGRLVNFGFCGGCIGTAVSLPLSGMIADRIGWEAVFYITGCMGLVWFIFFITIVRECPKEDPWISLHELNYIEDSLKETASNKKVRNHPWKSILTSPPVWAFIVGMLVESWGFYTFMTQLPSFMKDTMNYAAEQSGTISFVPYMVMTLVLYIQGGVSDWLEKNKLLTKEKIRKTYVCGAFLIQSLLLCLSGYLTSAVGIIVCITICIGIDGFSWGSLNVNALEISPSDSGVTMGIALTLAVCSGIVSPLLTGAIVQNKTKEEWQNIFYITSGLYLFGTVIYGTFASANCQEWAYNKKEESEDPLHSHALLGNKPACKEET